MHDRLVEVERLGPRGEHLVLGRRREVESLRLDVPPASAPRLQRDVVPARGERAAERDHREGVTGVAEGAEQHPSRWPRVRSASARHRRDASAGELGEQPQLLEALRRREGGRA